MTSHNDVASTVSPVRDADRIDGYASTATSSAPRRVRGRRAVPRSGLLYAREDLAGPVVGVPAREGKVAREPQGAVSDEEDDEARHRTMIALRWASYKRTGSSEDREVLILNYSTLVSQVASRLGMRLPSSVGHADLTSCGMFGLIDAIDKFEPGRDIKFETYASTRIRGAILDGLRAADWIPRSVRSRTRALATAVSELETSLHREPTREEIAAHLEVSLAEVHQAQSHAATSGLVALDELLDAGDRVERELASEAGPRGHADPAQLMESKELRFLLGQAICQLPERDRLMIVLYHFEGLTLADIGGVLGVTESRVSQLHTAAMRTLREKLLEASV